MLAQIATPKCCMAFRKSFLYLVPNPPIHISHLGLNILALYRQSPARRPSPKRPPILLRRIEQNLALEFDYLCSWLCNVAAMSNKAGACLPKCHTYFGR